MSRLWLPYEVTDVPAAEAFLTERLGLSTVDWWERRGESGRVLTGPDSLGPGAVIELVSAAANRAAPPAVEVHSRAGVDTLHRRFTAREVTRAPGRYPRGHYGFEVCGPGGIPLMIWSEQ
jgi:hypothetical protein